MPPRGVKDPKRQRQYEHIKESELERGEQDDRAEEIAARTVNKQRRDAGETTDQQGGEEGARRGRSGRKQTRGARKTAGTRKSTGARKGTSSRKTTGGARKAAAAASGGRGSARQEAGARKSASARKSAGARKRTAGADNGRKKR